MEKRNKRHVNRVKKLVICCFMCAIILGASTYAWFVGMKTVNVSSFDVEIAAIDGLSLSLDGETWSDSVSITKSTFDTASYEGNTNSWGGTGLIPISTVGKIDKTSSRMVMYEKGSLTTTHGGFRLMASQVQNGADAAGETDGYVAFDLFVKNLSGNEYYDGLANVLNEEAIYLTIDSGVKVATDGGVANTGIENSVRVAFAQIGRVIATTDTPSVITGISCTSDTNVTAICEDRDAQIWEPNDTKHVTNAINWYNTSCKKRTGADLTADESYSGACNTVADGNSYATYAVSGVIDYTDKIDVYDGTDYNGYGDSIATAATKGKLMAYNYFTDTEKNYAGTLRPTFINLAPNSITKIRIYVYIEGQDVDNYDFASLGKKISVAFGFTKERYFDEDVNYDPTDTATLPSDVIKDEHDGTNSSTPAEENGGV